MHSVRRAWLVPSKSNSFRTLGVDLSLSLSLPPLFLSHSLFPFSLSFSPDIFYVVSFFRAAPRSLSIVFHRLFRLPLFFSFYLSLLSRFRPSLPDARATSSPRRLSPQGGNVESTDRSRCAYLLAVRNAALPLGKSMTRMFDIISIVKTPRLDVASVDVASRRVPNLEKIRYVKMPLDRAIFKLCQTE